MPVDPRRVVSLAPSVTESILALGQGHRLVGISDFCPRPPDAPDAVRIGGLLTPDLERIHSLRPDLLVGTTSGNDPDLARQAETLAVPLYILHTPDVERVLIGLEGLSDALGDASIGRRLAERLRGRLAAVAAAVSGRPRPRVLFMVWEDPLIVPGKSAFLTDAIARAGGDSITADAPAAYPAYSVESAIARAPDVILTTEERRDALARLRSDAAWARVPAVRDGRLHALPDSVARPGPGIVDGIEAMARLLQPGAFPEIPTGKK